MRPQPDLVHDVPAFLVEPCREQQAPSRGVARQRERLRLVAEIEADEQAGAAGPALERIRGSFDMGLEIGAALERRMTTPQVDQPPVEGEDRTWVLPEAVDIAGAAIGVERKPGALGGREAALRRIAPGDRRPGRIAV